MTATEVLLLWAWMGSSLFFGWQMGGLIGYWRKFGWPQPRSVRRWVMSRRLKAAENEIALWNEVNREAVRRVAISMEEVAQAGVTTADAMAAFAVLGRELRGSR